MEQPRAGLGAMTSDAAFDAGEVRRAKYTIYVNGACCAGWVVINVVAAWLLAKPRLLGLSAAALAMIACWTLALRDLQRGRVRRGVLNYVTTGLLLLLAMGLFVPEMSVLFVFATFIFLAFGLSYANTKASSVIVALTVLVAGALLFTSLVLRLTSGVDPGLLRWVNVTGMTMALTINAVSFIGLRKTLEGRGQRLTNEAKFRALTESASDAIVTADRNGVITYQNGAAAGMFGWTAAEAVGKSLTILMPERYREQHRRGLERFVSTGERRVVGRRAVELVGLKRDGSEFPIELSLATWTTDRAPSFAAIIRDVTERRRIEDDLRRAKTEAEAASAELEAFSYSVAHDLRAPLRAIDGFSQALEEDSGGRLDSESIDHLRRIRTSAQQMAQLIDGLLGLSRVTRSELAREPVDLTRIAREVGDHLRAANGHRQVQFVVEEDLTAVGDAHLLAAALENLIANAWKFTRSCGQARIEVGKTSASDAPAFFVRDNGAGFKQEYAHKLFGAFQRLHSATEYEGTGIGLATVQRIIRRHGGRVWAEGEVGKGATFYFTL